MANRNKRKPIDDEGLNVEEGEDENWESEKYNNEV